MRISLDEGVKGVYRGSQSSQMKELGVCNVIPDKGPRSISRDSV
jgi:hypothetical protein